MSEFKILSINENGGDSDSLAAIQVDAGWRPGVGSFNNEIRVVVTKHRGMKITLFKDNVSKVSGEVVINRVHLDSLITFLQEAKTFIEEEEMIEKLKGKVASQR